MSVQGLRVKQAMIEAGLDQEQLAHDVGCTQGAISQIINGRSLRSRFLPDIARRLGVTEDYLRGFSDDPGTDAPPPPPPAVITARLEVTLGSEDALALMFEGLLAGLDRDAPRASQARLLAQKLPIALSSLRDLRVVTELRRDRAEASPEADERLATASPAPRP
ncbi:MAG: helix-turn-helix domain-containing protein [Sphingomonas parapaucimobilis]